METVVVSRAPPLRRPLQVLQHSSHNFACRECLVLRLGLAVSGTRKREIVDPALLFAQPHTLRGAHGTIARCLVKIHFPADIKFDCQKKYLPPSS
jgi:hypothetical protein